MAPRSNAARRRRGRLRVRIRTVRRGSVVALHRHPGLRRHAARARVRFHRGADRVSRGVAGGCRLARRARRAARVIRAAHDRGRRVRAYRMAARLRLHGLPLALGRLLAGAGWHLRGICAGRRRLRGIACARRCSRAARRRDRRDGARCAEYGAFRGPVGRGARRPRHHAPRTSIGRSRRVRP